MTWKNTLMTVKFLNNKIPEQFYNLIKITILKIILKYIYMYIINCKYELKIKKKI